MVNHWPPLWGGGWGKTQTVFRAPDITTIGWFRLVTLSGSLPVGIRPQPAAIALPLYDKICRRRIPRGLSVQAFKSRIRLARRH